MPAPAREALRARVFLKAMLPLLESVLRYDPKYRELFARVTAQVRFSTPALPFAATLDFSAGALQVVAEMPAKPTIDCRFRDVAAVNAFFSGGFVLPQVDGLRHPLLIAKVLRLMLALQVLKPGAPPRGAPERELRVRLILSLVSRALAQLYFGGYPPMVELVSDSPDRVYQWTVQRENIAVWLRMCRGRVKSGGGTYPHRAPFVHFVFPDVDAALRVFTSTEQMSGVRDGAVQTRGCPEYTRKVAGMMQAMDQLLLDG